MNNQGKNLFEKALETEMVFGTRRSPNAIEFKKAVIIKRNFSGKDIPLKDKKGKSFIKKGRRFTLVLTEELFNALVQAKGECSYGVWNFGGEENPELKLYTIEVRLNMDSANPPSCKLYTTSTNPDGTKVKNVTTLNSTNLDILDEVYECDIERVDIVVNPYDPDKINHFTLWLRDIKLSQLEIEDSDKYWEVSSQFSDADESPFGDPNED